MIQGHCLENKVDFNHKTKHMTTKTFPYAILYICTLHLEIRTMQKNGAVFFFLPPPMNGLLVLMLFRTVLLVDFYLPTFTFYLFRN